MVRYPSVHPVHLEEKKGPQSPELSRLMGTLGGAVTASRSCVIMLALDAFRPRKPSRSCVIALKTDDLCNSPCPKCSSKLVVLIILLSRHGWRQVGLALSSTPSRPVPDYVSVTSRTSQLALPLHSAKESLLLMLGSILRSLIVLTG